MNRSRLSLPSHTLLALGVAWSALSGAATAQPAVAPLLAQAPSQTLPQAQAPSAATFDLRAVTFNGAVEISQAELATLARPYIGHAVTLSDLEQLAKNVSELYHARGYFLAQALVPVQTVRDGAVEISVIEGKLNRIEINVAEDAPISAARARAFLAALKPGEALNAKRYERVMLLLSDQPGIKVASGLQQGIEPGTSDLVVEITAGRRWSFAADTDNFGTKEAGRVRVGGTARLNSPLGIGDNLDARLMISQSNALNLGRLSYEAPLNADGLRLGLGLSRVRYELGGAFEVLGATGTAQVFDASFNYPLIRQRNQNLFLRGGVEYKNLEDNLALFEYDSSKRVQNVNAGWAWERRDSLLGGGYWASSGTLYQGNLSLRDELTQFSDQGALGHHSAGSFSKLSMQVSRLQSLAARHSLYLVLGGQWANSNLDASEKLALGGSRAVRAMPSNELLINDGLATSAEWRWSATDDLTPYLFYDAGRGNIWHSPLISDGENTRSMQGYGLGATWSRPGNFSLNLALAWRSGNTAAPASDHDFSPRISFQAQKLF
ncbi:MAG: hypothetical protein LBF16_03610 [Pseudomonadales bacterium]|jgi:hemolysin activation/secretion protein|nr:hypothetical protein [Pseudomonadales bacterium]